MVPIIISHDGAVHRDAVKRWKDFAPDIKVDWVRMAQNVLCYNVVNVGRFSTKATGSPRRGEKNTEKNLKSPKESLIESLGPKREGSGNILTMILWALCVCGLRARHHHMAFG